MKTLKDLVIEQKCRKGESHAKTKDGAFWLAAPEVQIRSYGGDGIGNNGSDRTQHLQLRHYRSGEVKAYAHFHSWHQNYGSSDRYTSLDILGCTTIEDVIASLLTTKMRSDYDSDGDSVYSSYNENDLTDALAALGMVVALPAPDESVDS